MKIIEESYLPLGMYALRLCGNVDMAQDSVQNACEAILSRMRSGGKIDNLKAYLYRAVHNEVMTFMKATSLNADMDIESAWQTVTEEEIDTSERDAAVWKAVDALPSKRREVFLMCKRDGLSYAETAEELGISKKTVEVQMSKALASLRKALRTEGGQNLLILLSFL